MLLWQNQFFDHIRFQQVWKGGTVWLVVKNTLSTGAQVASTQIFPDSLARAGSLWGLSFQYCSGLKSRLGRVGLARYNDTMVSPLLLFSWSGLWMVLKRQFFWEVFSPLCWFYLTYWLNQHHDFHSLQAMMHPFLLVS